jgi:glycosyltransferase involved in cell wall biosynthesis
VGRVEMKLNRWRDIQDARSYDVVFVNRDLAGGGLLFEKRLLKNNPRVVFDFDDAIFIGWNEPAVRWMCQHAAWVTPGNEYLATYARKFTNNVTVIPTVIDTDKYVARTYESHFTKDTVRVGWSGSDQSIASTLFPYLEMLARLQHRLDFEFVIITNTEPKKLPVDNFRWKFCKWTPEAEADLGSTMDIGLMPLKDDEFQRGKCGLKLLQYMAAGIPTVASPVGVNKEITLEGRTGFLATAPEEWGKALEQLVKSHQLRADFGRAGRERCEQHYSIRRWLPTLVDIFEHVRTVAQ